MNDGEKVEVLGATVVGTMAPATAKGMLGFADTQYLVNRQAVQSPKEDDAQTGGAATATQGEGIFIPAGNINMTDLAAFVEALRNAMIVGTNDEDGQG